MVTNINDIPKMSINSAADFLGVSVQAVHKQLKAKNINAPKLGNKSYIDFKVAKELFNLKFERRVIAGQIVKGGTGKTTTIENVSSCANSYGARVLKIDADPQGNLTDVNLPEEIDVNEVPILIDVLNKKANIEDCVINITEGLDLIPSRIENVTLDEVLVNKRLPLDRIYHTYLQPIIDNYDFIFIDCPPYISQAVTAAAMFSDTLLVPLNPDRFSEKGLDILKSEIQLIKMHYDRHVDFKVFLNKFSGKTILSNSALFHLVQDPELSGHVLHSVIPYSQEIPNVIGKKLKLFGDLRKSVTRGDYDALTRELLNITAPNESKISKKSKAHEMEPA